MSELETVFFIHVPKTAGTSLRCAIAEVFPDRVAFDYGPQASDTTDWVRECVYDRRDRDRLRRELTERRIAVFGGHVGRKHYGDIFEPEQTIALVRDPVQRVISEWHHHRREFGIEHSLEEFAELPSVRNMQARLLGGCRAERYAVLGSTTHYPESLELIELRFGWRLPHLTLNQNLKQGGEGEPYDVNPELASRIAELNEADVKLHERIMELFRRRVRDAHPAQLGAPLRGCLDGYDRHGVVHGWACRLGDATPLQVRVLVDGEQVAVVTADGLRRDLREKGIHPTGRAGFRASVGRLNAGAVVRCLVCPCDAELHGSPWFFDAS